MKRFILAALVGVSWRRATRATLAPDLVNSVAMALPSPRLPPVMMALRPSIRISNSTSSLYIHGDHCLGPPSLPLAFAARLRGGQRRWLRRR